MDFIVHGQFGNSCDRDDGLEIHSNSRNLLALSAFRPVAFAALIVISSALGWGSMIEISWAWRIVSSSIWVAVRVPNTNDSACVRQLAHINTNNYCRSSILNSWMPPNPETKLSCVAFNSTFHRSGQCKCFLLSLFLDSCRTFSRCWMTAHWGVRIFEGTQINCSRTIPASATPTRRRAW